MDQVVERIPTAPQSFAFGFALALALALPCVNQIAWAITKCLTCWDSQFMEYDQHVAMIDTN